GTRRRDEAVLSRRASCGRMSKYRTPSSSRRSSGRRPTISPRRHPEYRPINGTQRKGPSSGSDSMRLRACSGVKGSRRSSPVAVGLGEAPKRRLPLQPRLRWWLALGVPAVEQDGQRRVVVAAVVLRVPLEQAEEHRAVALGQHTLAPVFFL